jgi:transcriptional regulator with XRE-family HTH domain
MQKTVSEVRKILAANLRHHRVIRSLSQEALADAAGLHRTFVGAVERSERNISLDNIAKLADALLLTPSELLRENEK